MASTWKSNEHTKDNSGERTLASVLVSAFRRNELPTSIPCTSAEIANLQEKFANAKRLRQRAASVRSPDSAIAAAVVVPIMTTSWTHKDLLGLRELTADEINFVLETTDAFKQVGTREIKKVPALRGKTLVNFFVEPSTRTRTSFELAAFA